MPLERQNWKAIITLLFLAVTMLTMGIALWIYRYEWSDINQTFSGKKVSQSEYLAVQAENILLKKMLGEIAGQVVVLGPATESANDSLGRLVWDKTTQGGYLFAKNLPNSAAGYSLWIKDTADNLFPAGNFTANAAGEIQSGYQASRPVYKPKTFLLARGPAAVDIIVRGDLP